MDASIAGNKLVTVYADIRQAFKIVDRIGLSVEVVLAPVRSGVALPDRSRAVFAWWRVGSNMMVSAAARVANVKKWRLIVRTRRAPFFAGAKRADVSP